MRATRGGLRVVSPIAPGLAARFAEYLFLSMGRHPRPDLEVAALETATPSRIAFEGSWLPLWTWTPPRTDRNDRDVPTVLLVHGFEGRGSQLCSFVRRLLPAGMRVVTFDAPGHGDCPLKESSAIVQARAIHAVAEAVGPLRGVVGHCAGGSAVLLATRFGMTAERVALIGAAAKPKASLEAFTRAFALDERVVDVMLARLEARYGLRYQDLEGRDDAAKLDVPLLVVHDAADPIVPWTDGSALARAAPQGRLVTTNGLGHRNMLRATEVIEEVVDFLKPAPEATYAAVACSAP